jgi:hypothetical protein
MPTLLFFDDWALLHQQNLQRRWFQAEPWPDLPPAIDPAMTLSYGSPTVIREPDGRWRMWAMGALDPSKGDGGAGTFLYRSSDGLHWEPDPQGALPGMAYSDTHAAVNGNCGTCKIATSPDGVHWTIDHQAVWQTQHTDTMFSISWNPFTRKYQFTGRPVLLDRRVALYQTADWRQFDEALVVLHPDPQDPALTVLRHAAF